MAIVERQTTTTRTHVADTGESDAGTGILVVLAVIVALAAAYFAYDYYATPGMDEVAMPATTSTINDGSTVTTTPVTPAPATAPASE